MANPQPTDSHFRISHKIEEEIMMRDFTKRQRSIMDFILRLSWGCGKKAAIIPMQKDFELVGIDQTKAKTEIEWLINAKVISRDVSGHEYSFNKNFDEWRVSIVPNYNKDRFNELLNINIKTCQNSKSLAETSSEESGRLDETASEDLTKRQVFLNAKPTEESVRGMPIESIKEVVVEEVEERAREAEIFKFYNQNIGMITKFQSEVIGQYIDEGLDPDMILAVLKDSIGKDDKWSWIKAVLRNSIENNVKTTGQYQAKKLERVNTKSRDKPVYKANGSKPPQTGNFQQRQYSDDYFENVYKEV